MNDIDKRGYQPTNRFRWAIYPMPAASVITVFPASQETRTTQILEQLWESTYVGQEDEWRPVPQVWKGNETSSGKP